MADVARIPGRDPESPGSNFRVAELRSARFSVGSSGPKSIEGQRAIVFLGSTNDGPIAIRCLKRPLEGGAERYGALRAYLADHPLPAITGPIGEKMPLR